VRQLYRDDTNADTCRPIVTYPLTHRLSKCQLIRPNASAELMLLEFDVRRLKRRLLFGISLLIQVCQCARPEVERDMKGTNTVEIILQLAATTVSIERLMTDGPTPSSSVPPRRPTRWRQRTDAGDRSHCAGADIRAYWQGLAWPTFKADSHRLAAFL